MLELSIQYGEEAKVDYNLIDRLAGLYTDVVDTKLLTIEEYAKSTSESINVLKNKLDVAKLLVEFLEYINAPRQFYIAREIKIGSPIEELGKLIKKCKNETEINDLKICAFNNILMQPNGDLTRFIRNIKDIISTTHKSDFLKDQKEIALKNRKK